MADKETDLPFGLCQNDADLLKSFHDILKSLRSLCLSNIEFYQRGRSSVHARFYATSCILLERSQVLEPLLIKLVPHLKEFDFSEKVQANGYRSFVSITHRCCLHLLQLCRHINVNKASLLFRSTHYLREMEDYVETLGQLIACIGYLSQLLSYSSPGELFVAENQTIADELLLEVEMLNTDCFYGRCLGFHFCESIQKILPGILIAMATFSECYEEDSQVMQLATSIFNSGKYVVDQDLRAKQVVDITRTADIKFCKAFWSIPESPLLSSLRSFTFPYVEVSEVMSLAAESFELPLEGSTDGATVVITPPCAHTGPAPVQVRLISHSLREGMSVTRRKFHPKTGSAKPVVEPKCRALLFHCHGGGFVSQSSQSHENYLRLWACKLKIPILSVDYSLSPDLPFPRALEECFYAYAWALKNPEQIGWTGEKVCFAGDSAGGNLAMSTALRAVSYEIHVPDGILAAYTPFLVQYTPSPSRLLSMIDPLLPVGILTRCLAAYAGIAEEFSSAIAKPIFCNPGNYESWEVVKEQEVGEEITCPLDNREPPVDVDNREPSVDNLKQPGAAADSTAADHTPVIPTEETGALDNPYCDSEDETEFVVCNLDDFGKDASNYAGEIVVVGDAMDQDIRDINALYEDCESNEACRLKASEDQPVISSSISDENVCTSKVPRLEQNAECDKDTKEQHSDQLRTLTEGGDSVENTLKDIDSTLVIHVNETSVEDEGMSGASDPLSGYAACQELLDAPGSSPHSPYTESDMMSASCHSIEDLLEPDIDNQHEDDKHDTTSGVDVGIENVGDSEGKRSVRCTKQHSVSDTSDSGVHVDTDEEKGSDGNSTNIDNGLPFNALNVAQESPDVTEDRTGKIRSLTEPTEASTVHHKKRTFSLDLAGHCHPGQIGDSKPQDILKSPVSPKLPKGSRSFTPKRFSVQRKIAQSPIQLFKSLPIVKNLYMSPLLAPADLLKGLPTVYLMACHFDPLLDDSIMFAKMLQRLDRPVELHVFDSLPHGFLCFADASLECKQAALYCMETIKKILKLVEE